LAEGRVAGARLLIGQAVDDRQGQPTNGILVGLQRLAGQSDLALASTRRQLVLRPFDTSTQALQLELLALSGDPDEAVALIADPVRRPSYIPAPAIAAY